MVARAARTRSQALEQWLPVGYFVAILAAVVVVLPSTLRPPQTPPTQSAELSPDAPPDKNQPSLVAAFNRAQSGTAGASNVAAAGGVQAGGAAAPGPPSPAPTFKPAFGHCVGKPPRQVESLYAGPCQPAWSGDNGGSTYHNVFPSEVHLAFYHSVDNCNAQPASEQPTGNESSGNRTARVLQAYFNTHFETYGRHLRFYCLPGGASDTDMANNATLADDTDKVFASSYIALGYCRDMVRRKLPVFCDPPGRDEMLAARPYMWSWQMDRTAMDELGAEYTCKKLVGKPAKWAGAQSGYRGLTRKIGVITEVTSETGVTEKPLQQALQRECGVTPVQIIYSSSASSDEVAAGLARLKAEGVTSVVLNIKFTNTVLTLQAADGAAYYPEWLEFSPWGLDINIIGNLMAADQMTQAFGLSGWEWPRSNAETECYRAYKEMDPGNDPDGGTCGTLWPEMVQLVSGISGAGPHLTPETFRDGLLKMGYRWYPELPFAIGGGYSPTDYTYIDNVGEIWWDPSAPKPEDNSPGAYRWVRCGHRYRKGELPQEDPLVFQNGSTGPGRYGCPPA